MELKDYIVGKIAEINRVDIKNITPEYIEGKREQVYDNIKFMNQYSSYRSCLTRKKRKEVKGLIDKISDMI